MEKKNLSIIFEDLKDIGAENVKDIEDDMLWGLDKQEIEQNLENLIQSKNLDSSQVLELKKLMKYDQMFTSVKHGVCVVFDLIFVS